MSGQVEVDEPFFGAYRAKCKRGHCTFSKTAENGIYKHNWQCCVAEIAKNCRKKHTSSRHSLVGGTVRRDLFCRFS